MDSNIAGETKTVEDHSIVLLKPGKNHLYKCGECEKSYGVYSSYYSHTQKKHRPKKIKCSSCEETFHFKSELYRHSYLKGHQTQLSTAMSTASDIGDNCDMAEIFGAARAFTHTKELQAPNVLLPRSNLSSCFALDFN
jgi:DNA-directed RNA polymerase subunit M/transcription elongation factor TFIIS